MATRILLADQGEARFYDVKRLDEPLRLAGRIVDANARLHDRDLKSDRPGRVFDHAVAPGQRRGAVSHHATGGERTPRKHEAELFARQIGRELGRALQKQRFDRLIVVAGPPFLGTLRSQLPKAVSATLIREIPKDLLHHPEIRVRAYIQRGSTLL